MFRRLLCGVVLVVLVGCGGSDDPGVPSATIAPADPETTTTSTTEALTPEEEVEAAYLKSWEVYAEAVRELDDSRLAEVFAGDQLQRTIDEVRALKERNTPILVQVDHDYTVELTSPGVAVVEDHYVNRSVFVDPESGQPTESEPNDPNSDAFTLKEVEGRWVVIDILRGSS